MKKFLLFISFLFCAAFTFAQYPLTQNIGGDSTMVNSKGALKSRLVNHVYADTTAANLEEISHIAGAQIVAGNQFWIRDSTATHWLQNTAASGSSISVINDSTLQVCNYNGCDTFITHTAIPISTTTVLSDTIIQVCNSNGTCDSIIIPPTNFSTYVDSVKIDSGRNSTLKDTLRYWINNAPHIGGYIGQQINTQLPVTVTYNSDSTVQTLGVLQPDGIISGGIVTWSGTGLTYYVSPCVYQIGGVVYSSPQTAITLAAADPTYARQDVFIVDTTGTASYLEGTPSASPTAQQPNAYQLALTTGITLNAGDTIPSSVTFNGIVYDEGLGTSGSEWNTTSSGTITYDTLDISNPFHLTKDLFVSSYNSNATLFFTGASQLVYRNSDVFSFHIYTNGNFKNKLYVAFVDNGTRVSDYLQVSSRYGFNPNNGNIYQVINMPLLSFHWYNAGTYDGIEFFLQGNDNTGTNGFFLDYLFLQTGTTNTSPATDYSNKVDSSSITKVNDTTYVLNDWIKGIKYPRNDTIYTHTSGGGGGSGTVTSVATTNGYGISSSVANATTTPNITIATDSSTLSSYYLRRKDSVATGYYPYSSNPKGYILPSDTAAMLGHYFKDFSTPTDTTVDFQRGDGTTKTLTITGGGTVLNGTGYVKMSGTTPSYQTPTQVTADLNVFTSSLKGLVPSGGTANQVLHGDGTWRDTTASGGGSSVSSGTYASMIALSPTNGQQYVVNNYLPGIWQYAEFDSTWHYLMPPVYSVYPVNAFSSTAGTNSGTGAGYSFQAPDQSWTYTRFGDYVDYSTGSTSSGYTRVNILTPSGYSVYYNSAIKMHYKLQSLSNSTDRYYVSLGSSYDRGNFFFEYCDSLNSGNWVCVAHTGAVYTQVNTSVAADNSPHEFVIYYVPTYLNLPISNSNSWTAYFYIDKTLVGTIGPNTASLGSGSYGMFTGWGIYKTAGTTQGQLYFYDLTIYNYENDK